MKNVYRIATSLDRSYLDVEVALQAKSGVGLRPLPLYTIFVWIIAIFGSFIWSKPGILLAASAGISGFPPLLAS